MMNQQVILTHLVAGNYHGNQVRLQPITEYMFEDRGIYRAELDDGQPYVLRAFRAEVEEDLLGQVAVLDYLGQQNIIVPQVLRTQSGAALASDGSWTALMISFIEGEMADFSPHTFTQLGTYLGTLHSLSAHIMEDEKIEARLPESRLHPDQITPLAIAQFSQSGQQLPRALQPFHREALEAIKHLQVTTSTLPITLLHGDCWAHNAIITREGELAMIDWDGCGLGPAILDLGYLLLTCHLGKPQLPAIEPDPQLINAVIQGYTQQRQVAPAELSVLEEAIFYDSARRAILDGLFLAVTEENWSESLSIQKLLARQAASKEIAWLAREYLERSTGNLS